MKLVTRVSSFFLAALALVLLANGVLLYSMQRQFLNQRFEQQLHAALHTLVAAVEVEDDDVKWEPSDHTISLGAHDGLDDIRWMVFSDEGRLVDRSHNLMPAANAAGIEDAELVERAKAPQHASPEWIASTPWRFLDESLVAPHPKSPGERDSKEFAGVRVVVARSALDMRANLQQLNVLLWSLSGGTWLIAALVGRWYCRRALQPVSDMAAKARSVEAADFHMRLPTTSSNDELSELGNAFNALLGRLHAAFKRQERFTSDAAHQLRTPLTVLMGEIDVALRRPRTDVEYRSALDRLRGQTLELHQMVEALLFLARSEPDRNLPGVETKDCRTWLELYSERWDDNPRWNDLSFSANEGLVVATSWPLVAQLLDILIDNALKYSPAETRVRITMSRSYESLLIDVVDHGEGIDPKDHEAVFDPFIRTAEARRSGVVGTGLGLAICKGIVQALRGTIELASEAGKGSHFRIEIAAAESEELDGTSTTTARQLARKTAAEPAAT